MLRKLLAQILFSLSVFIVAPATHADFKSAATILLEGLQAEHTTAPVYVASRRFYAFGEDKFSFDQSFSGVASASVWAETEYYSYLQYPEQLRKEDARDLRFQDTYLQYKADRLIFRAGWQQIVWGETFGSFYADVVNPKDLRQGIPANSASIRLASPALNLRYIKKRFSVQGIFLPQSSYNIVPLSGSDFSPPLEALTGFDQVIIHREKDSEWSLGHSEWGGRISQTFGNVDASVFEFTYFDRSPYYLLGPSTVPGQVLELDERHSRVNSLGGSIAADFEGFVLRGEGVYTNNRYTPVLESPNVINTLTDELAYAVSIDFPTLNRVNLTLQYSDSRFLKEAQYLLRNREIEYFTGRALLNLFTASTLEFMMTYSARDAGFRTQLVYSQPLSSIFEMSMGLDDYNGASDSAFGQIRHASRAFISVRARFNAGRTKAEL